MSETRSGKRSGISPDNVSAVAAALVTSEYGGEAFVIFSPSVMTLDFTLRGGNCEDEVCDFE